MLIKTLFFLCYIILTTGFCVAQNPDLRFTPITVKNGLAHNEVTAITQDREGYVWIATNGGLHRFDGNRFIVFNPEKDNSASLSHGRIYSLFIDYENSLWVGTLGGGLNRYNHREENFTRFVADPENPSSISSNDIYAICEDEDHHLWVGTFGGGLNLFDKNTERFIRFDLGEGQDTLQQVWNSIRAMVPVSDHQLMIGLDKGGVVIFDTKNKKVVKRYLNEPGNASGISDNTINSFFRHHNKFYIGTWYGGVNEFTPDDGSFKSYMHNPEDEYSLSSNIVMATGVDRNGGVWAGTWNSGLNYRPPGEDKFYCYTNNAHDPTSLSGNRVLSVFEDRQGIIWLGTNAGISKVQPYPNKFFHIDHHPEENNSLSGNNVSAFAEDNNGNIWIGTRGAGLNKFNVHTGEITQFRHNPKGCNTLPHNSILSLHADENYLWIGTEGAGLARLNMQNNKFEEYRQYFNERSNAVFDIEKDNNGNIWFSTWGDGVNRFNPATKEITNYPIDSIELNNNAVLCILVEKNTVWMGSFGRGLVKLNRQTGEKSYFSANAGGSTQMPNWAISSILRSNDGKLWVGTDGGGLALFDPANGSFKTYTEDNGLPSNIVQGITGNSDGCLWLTTYGGISKFDPDKEQFFNFDTEDGLQNGVFTPRAIFQTDSGLLLAGGANGINYFYPDSIKTETYNPRVKLTGFNIFNKRITAASEKYTPATSNSPPEVNINYKDRIISFEFNVFNFSGHDKIKYAYILEGVNPDWVPTGPNQQFASYSNLDPGKYNFYVKATNNYGEWNELPLVVKVNVKPAFWQTIFFKIMVTLITIVLVVLFIRNRVKKQVKQQKILEGKVARRTAELKEQKELIESQNKELERANATKNKFFQIIGHDLRTPVGGLYSLSELLLTEYDNFDANTMRSYLSIMKKSGEETLNLLNNLLDWARTQTNRIKINRKEFNLVEEIESVTKTLTTAAEQKQIVIKFHDKKENLVYADRSMIQTVLHNLLSNAIKFTQKTGNIEITTQSRTKDVRVAIADNGVGIPENIKPDIFNLNEKVSMPGTEKESGTGLGLILCKEFTELNKGEIEFESMEGKGTTFYFTIPKAQVR